MFIKTVSVLVSVFFIIGVGSQSASLDIGDPSKILTDVKVNIDVSKIKSPDDVPQIQAWKEDCERDHGAETVKDIEAAPMEMVECVKQYVKVKKLKIEVDRSMAKGNLDLVFKKYCGYGDNIMACVDVMLDKFRICMTPQQLVDVNVTRRAIDAAINFTCHNDGDRIALFMAEEGVECLESKKDGIRTCVEERVPEIQEGVSDPDGLSLDDIVINEEQCSKLGAIHECIVHETTQCNDSTPANILDSLIKQMLKATPCWELNEKARSSQSTGATSGAANIGGLVKNTIANIGPILVSSVSSIVGLAGVLAGCGGVILAAILSHVECGAAMFGELVSNALCYVSESACSGFWHAFAAVQAAASIVSDALFCTVSSLPKWMSWFCDTDSKTDTCYEKPIFDCLCDVLRSCYVTVVSNSSVLLVVALAAVTAANVLI